jgi:chemotaxis protein MotB
MARDPFADVDGSAVSGSIPPGARSSGVTVMRVVSGISVIALLGLLFGYYLPLRSAHTLLNEKYQAKSSELGGTTDQLEKTTAQLVAAQAERDQLKADAEKVVEAKEERGDGAEKIKGELDQSLSRLVKAKIVSVDVRGERTVVTIDDKQLFGKRDTSTPPKSKKLLCELGKALKGFAEGNDLVVSGHTASNKVTDPVLKRDLPSVWQLSAVRAAAVVSALQGCGVAGGSLRAVGLADTQPSDSTPKGSTGETRITIQARR